MASIAEVSHRRVVLSSWSLSYGCTPKDVVHKD